MRPTDDSTFIERFINLVEFTDECWLWKGSRVAPKKKYGKMKFGGRMFLAHVISYRFFNNCKEDIPFYLIVHHICEVQHCVNPDHLELQHIREHERGHLIERYWNS